MAGNKNAPVSAKGNNLNVNTNAVSPFSFTRLFEDPHRLFVCQKICVVIIAFFVYANSIPNGFNVDDIYYTTEENPLTAKGINAIPEIFTNRSFHDNNNNSFDYRPIPMLTFALQHQFLGFAPVIGHFINVLVYACICLLIFTLLYKWFGPDKKTFAFLVVLLYAVHPLHTEVVCSIKSRDELLAVFFFLLSAHSIWKWHMTGRGVYIALCFLLFCISILCKTTTVIYSTIIPLSFYFFSRLPIKKIILPTLVFFAGSIIVAVMVSYFIPEPKRVFAFFENPLFTSNVPIGVLTATATYILGGYARLHVVPHPLSFYYGYKYVQFLQWNSVSVILSLIPYLFLFFLILKGIRKKSIAAFGALLYLACILPFSNLLKPVAGMMAERLTVMSSLGYCILFVSLLFYLFKIAPKNLEPGKKVKYLSVIFLLVFTCYSIMTIARNAQWKDKWTLYSHDIKHLENSVKVNMFYGEELSFKARRCRTELAAANDENKRIYLDSLKIYRAEEKRSYLRALAIVPDYVYALKSLAAVYIGEDSCAEGKIHLLHAREVAPDDWDTRYNLAIAYRCLGIIDSAESEFKATLGIYPKYAPAYTALTLIYINRNDTAAAVNNLLAGINVVPESSVLYTQLARVYMYKRDTTQAIYYSEKGAALPDPDPELFSILQGYYHAKGNAQKEMYYRNRRRKDQ